MSKNEGKTYLSIAAGSLLFYSVGLPVFDAISSYIQSQFNYHSATLKNKLDKETSEMSEAPIHVVGFQIPSEEECYGENEDE